MPRAALLLSVLIVLCSQLAACGGKVPALPPAPVVEERIFPAAPVKPVLPALADEELESMRNVRVLLQRDDMLRRHIDAMHDWAAQVPQGGKP